MSARGSLAVVGGGWAGLAAAVRATEAGHAVTLYDTAAQFGGRARGVEIDGLALDNGQHILIGAYTHTLALMQTVGADAATLLQRLPLTLRDADGRGLQSPGGPAALGFVRAVVGCVGWSWGDRLSLLVAAAGWACRRFRCDPALTVAALCSGLPPRVRSMLIDPLCVAALNTPAQEASAAVLLRVLQDALFGGRGAADLLLPRRPLSALLPEPATRWLAAAGAELRPGTRIVGLERDGRRWLLNGRPHDAVVLACTATEAARLTAMLAPAWSARAAALRHAPIVTVYLRCPDARFATPMLALAERPDAPAQFAFDLGALGGPAQVFALAVSGAERWIARGLDATGAAALRQVHDLLPGASLLRVLAEKRATFRCTPGLDRPPAAVAAGLLAAGDYVEGPYPATLEGAVRAGEQAVARLGA